MHDEQETPCAPLLDISLGHWPNASSSEVHALLRKERRRVQPSRLLRLFMSRPEGCEIPSLHSSGNTFLVGESPALLASRSTQQECRPGVWRLHQCEVTSFRSCGCFPRMRSIWFRERGQDLWSRPEGCADRKAAKIRVLHNEGPALQESRSAQGERLHQCEVMSLRSCGCFPRMRSIWLRERGQDLWTMCNIKSPGLRRPFRGMRGS